VNGGVVNKSSVFHVHLINPMVGNCQHGQGFAGVAIMLE
jgi:hypothetical protein